jgi:hypothetical protein
VHRQSPQAISFCLRFDRRERGAMLVDDLMDAARERAKLKI